MLFFKVNNNKPPVVGLSLSVAFLKKKLEGKSNRKNRMHVAFLTAQARLGYYRFLKFFADRPG